MQLSAKYAHRPDLSVFEKWRFTLEDQIQANSGFRTFYRGCRMLPKSVKATGELLWFFLGLLPLLLADVCEVFVQKIFGEDAEGYGTGIFFLVTITAAFYQPLMWIFVAMTIQFVAVLWFLETMREYGHQLQREDLH